MNEPSIENQPSETPNPKRNRNIILGLVLAAAVVFMYVSIIYRLSVNPLG